MDIVNNDVPVTKAKRYIISIVLPIIGIVFLAAGPILLHIADKYVERNGYLTKNTANIISNTALFLPVISVIICIIIFVKWKKTGKLGHAFALTTVFMYNPLIYYFYLMICEMARKDLSGVQWKF